MKNTISEAEQRQFMRNFIEIAKSKQYPLNDLDKAHVTQEVHHLISNNINLNFPAHVGKHMFLNYVITYLDEVTVFDCINAGAIPELNGADGHNAYMTMTTKPKLLEKFIRNPKLDWSYTMDIDNPKNSMGLLEVMGLNCPDLISKIPKDSIVLSDPIKKQKILTNALIHAACFGYEEALEPIISLGLDTQNMLHTCPHAHVVLAACENHNSFPIKTLGKYFDVNVKSKGENALSVLAYNEFAEKNHLQDLINAGFVLDETVLRQGFINACSKNPEIALELISLGAPTTGYSHKEFPFENAVNGYTVGSGIHQRLIFELVMNGADKDFFEQADNSWKSKKTNILQEITEDKELNSIYVMAQEARELSQSSNNQHTAGLKIL